MKNKKRIRFWPALTALWLVLSVYYAPVDGQTNDGTENSLPVLIDKFERAARDSWCGKREEALKTGRQIVARYGADPAAVKTVRQVTEKIAVLEKETEAESLAELYGAFRMLRKCECGKREEAIRIGKIILEKFKNDELNQAIIEFVRKQIAIIEKEDARCRLVEQYDDSYKAKNWPVFFEASKAVLAKEKNPQIALDIYLTGVRVGHRLYLETRDARYKNDAQSFARIAVEMIDAGISSSNWGTYEFFGNREQALKHMRCVLANFETGGC